MAGMARFEAAQRLYDRYDRDLRRTFLRDFHDALATAESDDDRAAIIDAAMDVAPDHQTAHEVATAAQAAEPVRYSVGDGPGRLLDADGFAERDPRFRMVREKVAAASTAVEAHEIINAALASGAWSTPAEWAVLESLKFTDVSDDGTLPVPSSDRERLDAEVAETTGELNRMLAERQQAEADRFDDLLGRAVAEAEAAEAAGTEPQGVDA